MRRCWQLEHLILSCHALHQRALSLNSTGEKPSSTFPHFLAASLPPRPPQICTHSLMPAQDLELESSWAATGGPGSCTPVETQTGKILAGRKRWVSNSSSPYSFARTLRDKSSGYMETTQEWWKAGRGAEVAIITPTKSSGEFTSFWKKVSQKSARVMSEVATTQQTVLPEASTYQDIFSFQGFRFQSSWSLSSKMSSQLTQPLSDSTLEIPQPSQKLLPQIYCESRLSHANSLMKPGLKRETTDTSLLKSKASFCNCQL